MSRKKKKPAAKPGRAIPRPEELAFLKRWQNTNTTSVWKKMDRDVVYEAAVKARVGDTGECSMSNQWGIGKPYPKFRNQT